MYFQARGHEVLEASTGSEGVRMFLDEKVDCVITDIIMPDMNGLDAIRKIRKKAEGCQ